MLADTALLHIVVPAPLSFMFGMFAGILLVLFLGWLHRGDIGN